VKRRVSRWVWAIMFALLLAAPAASQPLSLTGNLYRVNPRSARPTPLSGYMVYAVSKRSFGPVLTDVYGRYAFYGIPPGHYALRITNRNHAIVWQQPVNVPGAVPPIVLPR